MRTTKKTFQYQKKKKLMALRFYTKYSEHKNVANYIIFIILIVQIFVLKTKKKKYQCFPNKKETRDEKRREIVLQPSEIPKQIFYTSHSEISFKNIV